LNSPSTPRALEEKTIEHSGGDARAAVFTAGTVRSLLHLPRMRRRCRALERLDDMRLEDLRLARELDARCLDLWP
jgi:uncharacterized protein YjiS (DUF1127 family)